jgi:hypothetical protein
VGTQNLHVVAADSYATKEVDYAWTINVTAPPSEPQSVEGLVAH